MVMAILNELGSMQKAEVLEMQVECLSICKELTCVGDKDVESPLRLPDGRWAASGLEDNPLLVMTLVAHVLLFNSTSFFDGNALKEMKESFSGLIPFGAKTSTSSPGHQS